MKKRTKITEGEYFDVEYGEQTAILAPEHNEDEYLIGLFVRTTLSQRKKLEELATRDGVSLAELVRQAINLYADTQANQLKQSQK